MRISSSERGNAFWFILIGIVLFAALSYAIASGGRSGIGGVSEERIKLTATEIIQFGTALESAVARATLGGNKIWGLDFNGPLWTRRNGNPIAEVNGTCTSGGCRIFGPTLGLSEYKYTDDVYYTANTGTAGAYAAQGASMILWARVKNLGTNSPEVLLLVPHLRKEVCTEINRKLGNGLPTDPPTDATTAVNSDDYSYPVGTQTAIPAFGADDLGDAATEIVGKTAFCVLQHTDYGYYYYQVLAVN